MQRKITKVGNSSLMISLPHVWAKQHSLKAGTYVNVQESGPRLIVDTEGKISSPPKISIHLKKGQIFMKRYFRVMYIDGYDEIEVTSEDVLDQKRVKTALNQLLGFEAIEFTPHKVIVRNIATPNADQFDNIFRRLFLIVLNYGRTTLEIMQKGNYEQALELQDMEPTINKFCFFCERVLMKHDIHSRQKTLHWYSFAGAIEQIADFSGYLCETLIRQKKPLSKTILTAATNVTKILEEIYKVFYDFNIETLTQLRKTRRSQILVLMELFHKKLSPAETEILSSLLLMMNALKEMEIEMVSLYAKPDK